MKKALAIVLSAALAVSSFSAAIKVSAASSSSAIVDMHGSKTYLGEKSDWSKTWDEDNFEDVTGKDVEYDGDLTIKSGKMKDVVVQGDRSNLTIKGGTMEDVNSYGSVKISSGTMKAVDVDDDVEISGGTIKGDVTSQQGDITLRNDVSVNGDISGCDVDIGSGSTVNIAGSITGTGVINLSRCNLKVRSLDGSDDGKLEIKDYSEPLPEILNMKDIVVYSNQKVFLKNKITAESLYVAKDSELITDSTLELDELQGPGTLYMGSGKLTVHDSILDKPLLIFRNTVSSGTVAFRGDSGSIDEDDMRVFGYTLEADTSGDRDEFKLKRTSENGVFLDKNSLSVDSKTTGTVKATIKPALSRYADGTKLLWKLYGDTSAFSVSSNSSDMSCNISLSGSATGTKRATLVEYLVDSKGDILDGYRSDTCVITTGYIDNVPSQEPSSDSVRLDTSEVSILTGNRYGVMAITGLSSAPKALSYNSAIATVSAPTKVQNGWVYTVTGVSKGQVTIEIGGQKMIATVSGGILVDTQSYTMSPGGKYCIGVKIHGIDENKLNVYSVNSCTNVELYKKGTDGTRLYQVTGKETGTGYIMFEIGSGRAVKTRIDVQNGASASGTSARMVALA